NRAIARLTKEVEAVRVQLAAAEKAANEARSAAVAATQELHSSQARVLELEKAVKREQQEKEQAREFLTKEQEAARARETERTQWEARRKELETRLLQLGTEVKSLRADVEAK